MYDEVRVDCDLEELIPTFLTNRKQDIENIKRAFHKHDWEQLTFIGHGLKGTAYSYQFEHMGNLGKRIEFAAKETNAQEIQRCITELDRHMNALNIIYEEVE